MTDAAAKPARRNRLFAVVLPSGVTTLGESAFEQCLTMTRIAIPPGVTSFGGGAFAACVRLEELRIPDAVTRVGPWCFGACDSLKVAEVPAALSGIDMAAFGGQTKLSRLVLSGTEIAPILVEKLGKWLVPESHVTGVALAGRRFGDFVISAE
jgi:hypothetical protein